jgi:predicted amidohydrolase YtcJ
MKYSLSKKDYALGLILALVIFLLAISPAGAQDGNDVVTRIILHNGKIYTMAVDPPIAEAILIEGNLIVAIGTNDAILDMADENTTIFDLQGRAVFPGFIDPHTHLFGQASSIECDLDEIQQLALEVGVTSAGSMHVSNDQIENYRKYAEEGGMHLRLYLYLNYNDSCGNVWGTWYEEYPPDTEIGPKLRVNGVKIFSEKSVCDQNEHEPVFSRKLLNFFTPKGLAAWGDTQLLFSLRELKNVIKRATDHGYQVAIHAIGDSGIETSLEAIEYVLKGSQDKKANRNRHMVLHNHFLTNDLLHKYAENNILALIEPATTCQANYYAKLVGDRNMKFFKRVEDLVQTGAHVALDSDWPYSSDLLNPMKKLGAIVTGRAGSCVSDIPLQTVSVWQGLKMMTSEAAYALHCDDQLGSLEIGKLADLVVLSDDPHEVLPENIRDIQVLLTMVDGKIEFLRDTSGESIPGMLE